MNKLTDEQIRLRLQEGRNYKRLYAELKVMFDEVVKEHKQCPKLLAEQQQIIETLKVRVGELETMVFGKRRKPPTGHYLPDLPKPEVLPRNKDSYRRPIPPASAITNEEPVLLESTCQCGGKFKEITTHERYERYHSVPTRKVFVV